MAPIGRVSLPIMPTTAALAEMARAPVPLAELGGQIIRSHSSRCRRWMILAPNCRQLRKRSRACQLGCHRYNSVGISVGRDSVEPLILSSAPQSVALPKGDHVHHSSGTL